MDFDGILGNEVIKNHFRTAVRNQKVSHAYLIEGEKGSGKKMISAAFAKILQCEEHTDHACGKCTSCIQIQNMDHPDVIWLSHEKANVISVGEVREQLVNTIDVKPYKGPYKIYIIDEAEKLNEAAQNAILKTIEEPPEYAVLILLTSNKGSFLQTILSRCIQLSMKPLAGRTIQEYMMRTYTLEEERAGFFASYSMGNIGKAMEAFASESFGQMKDVLVDILKEIDQSFVYQVYQSLKELQKQKEKQSEIFDLMMIWYHDVLVIKSKGGKSSVIFKEYYDILEKQADKLEYENIQKIMDRIQEARAQGKANVKVEHVLESLFFDIKRNYRIE